MSYDILDNTIYDSYFEITADNVSLEIVDDNNINVFICNDKFNSNEKLMLVSENMADYVITPCFRGGDDDDAEKHIYNNLIIAYEEDYQPIMISTINFMYMNKNVSTSVGVLSQNDILCHLTEQIVKSINRAIYFVRNDYSFAMNELITQMNKLDNLLEKKDKM